VNSYLIHAQIIVAVSIVVVWVFRFDNIVKEFKQYGLSDQMRNFVGAAKIALATLLVAGIWHPSLVLIPSLLMAIMMVCAQAVHFKIRNPFIKYVPSLGLLALSLFIAGVQSGIIS